MFSSADVTFMSQALQLAEKGLFTTSPNPRVGCVIVRNGAIVGSGWHERAGQPHAEINALTMAGDAACDATAYITLEPCSHYGRTPPCVEALIKAGITRAVIAMEDPNPQVFGTGCARMRQAGISVETGLLQAQALALNVGFVKRMQQRKPWLRLKIAASLDGKTALSNGRSQWITGEAARRDGHRWRARACGVMTGIGTILSDNARLSVRDIPTTRQPKKIIVDSRLSIPLDAHVLQGQDTFIFTACGDNSSKIAALRKKGAQVIVLQNFDRHHVDLPSMMEALAGLELNEVLVEAGSRLNGTLLSTGLADELIIYFAPSLLGSSAQAMFQLPELDSLAQKIPLKVEDIRMIGKDIRIMAGLDTNNGPKDGPKDGPKNPVDR